MTEFQAEISVLKSMRYYVFIVASQIRHPNISNVNGQFVGRTQRKWKDFTVYQIEFVYCSSDKFGVMPT